MAAANLIEEDVLPVDSLGGVLFENALGRDAVLLAQVLPELEANLVAALAQLKHYHLARHDAAGGLVVQCEGERLPSADLVGLRRDGLPRQVVDGQQLGESDGVRFPPKELLNFCKQREQGGCDKDTKVQKGNR